MPTRMSVPPPPTSCTSCRRGARVCVAPTAASQASTRSALGADAGRADDAFDLCQRGVQLRLAHAAGGVDDHGDREQRPTQGGGDDARNAPPAGPGVGVVVAAGRVGDGAADRGRQHPPPGNGRPASVWSAQRCQPAGSGRGCGSRRSSRTASATRRRVMLASAGPNAGADGSSSGSSQAAAGSPAPEPQPHRHATSRGTSHVSVRRAAWAQRGVVDLFDAAVRQPEHGRRDGAVGQRNAGRDQVVVQASIGS